jgi:hypothetical protein
MTPQSHFRAGLALLPLMAAGLSAGLAQPAAAAPARTAPLGVVRPVGACEQLAATKFDGVTDAPTTVTAAKEIDTAKGRYCQVEGTVAPGIAFTVALPVERWTQRFLENAMGRQTPGQASSCAPALNGEMVVASARSVSGRGMNDSDWTTNWQMRIDYAYRGNHQTALVAKALIRAYYGQAPRYSYFMGCSEGGRQALMQAQRYPDDFDGVTAGAPVAIDSVHNAFYHPWEDHVNRRADGSRVLASNRLGLLHAAVMQHCGPVSGVIDGTLQNPLACTFERKWVECAPGADAPTCLTPEETDVVEKLYAGASDGKGHFFEISGWPLGSEKFWKLSTATQYGDRETKEGAALRRLLLDADSLKPASQLDGELAYTQAWYDKLSPSAGLFNAANTNLAPFRAHGGKLILWHGAEDLTVQPAISIAYYEGVKKTLGAKATDEMMRLFLFPGMAHCVGGEGATQIDLLTPLMEWTERGQAPSRIVAAAVAPTARGGPGPGQNQSSPLPEPAQPALFTRPAFPFPAVARYSGKGPVDAAASYVAAPLKGYVVKVPARQVNALIAPDNQPVYTAGPNGLTARRK